MSETEEISSGILFLIDSKIYQADQVIEKKERVVKEKEHKKQIKAERVEISYTDRALLERYIWNCQRPSDKEEYFRLVEDGLMAIADIAGEKIYGVTPKGQVALRE